MSKTKVERLQEELGRASGALEKAEVKAKEARGAVLLAIESGEGVSLARSREEDARAAVATARREASDVAEVLRKARDEEERRRHDEEVDALAAEARKFAAAADEGLKAGVAKVAAGFVEIGKALVAAADSEDADSALEALKAPPAGRGRLRAIEVQDAIAQGLLAAYPSPDRGNPWAVELRLVLVPLRCVAPGKK
jgi:hypothetical protein